MRIGPEPDTLYYSIEFGAYATARVLALPHRTMGADWDYEYRQIVSGHCSPDIYALTTAPCLAE